MNAGLRAGGFLEANAIPGSEQRDHDHLDQRLSHAAREGTPVGQTVVVIGGTHLEEKLAPHHFIRVRKSAIVNGACISEIRPMFDGVYDIILAEGTVVTSSRRYAHKLRALLES